MIAVGLPMAHYAQTALGGKFYAIFLPNISP